MADAETIVENAAGGEGDPPPVDDTASAGTPENGDTGGGDGGEPKKPGTLAGEEGGEEQADKPAGGDWPDDWREKLAGGDEKLLARLKRFASPANVLKSWRELETRVSSGEFKKSLPANATEEQVAAYRKEHGIPEAPDGYFEALDGTVIGEADKPIVAEFMALAHADNLPPAQVKKTLDWYYATKERLAQEQAEADTAYRAQAVEELRGEYGGEFKRNFTDLKAWVGSAGDDVANLFFGARLPDGTLLGDNPAVLKWMIGQMREMNPLSAVVPSGGGDAMSSVESEIAEIEKLMNTNREAYWRDEGKQKRLRELYAAREKHGKKVA